MDTLDLDALAPSPVKVKINGQTYEIKPILVADFPIIYKIITGTTSKSAEEQAEMMSSLEDRIEPVVPEIKKMKLSFPQFISLLSFLISAASDMSGNEKKVATPLSLKQ